MIVGGVNTNTALETVTHGDNAQALWADVIKMAVDDLSVSVKPSKTTIQHIEDAYRWFLSPAFQDDRETVFLLAGVNMSRVMDSLRPRLNAAREFLTCWSPLALRGIPA